jgi:hypothetical protein
MKTDIKSRGLAICTPTTGRKLPFELNFDPPANLLMARLQVIGKPVDVARNMLIASALEHECRLLWFVDDDIEPPFNGLGKLVYELENHPEAAMISAVCPSRQDPPAPMIFNVPGDGPFWDWKAAEVFEAPGGVGFGCVLIRTEWLERISAPWCKSNEEQSFRAGPSVFTKRSGEDIYCCDKIRAAGGIILVDGSVICKHHDVATGRVYELPANSLPWRSEIKSQESRVEARAQKAEEEITQPLSASAVKKTPEFAVVLPHPPGYMHRGALLESAETVHYGLMHLGVDAWLCAELVPGAKNIVFGSHLLSHFDWLNLPADSILYNTEPLGEEAIRASFQPNIELMKPFRIWHMSKSLHERALALCLNSTYVPLGYVPEMTRIKNRLDPDIDALLYGAVTPRREAIVNQLREAGLNVPDPKILFGRYGAERDSYMARAKIILNVHSYIPRQTFAVARVVYALANVKPVLCEANGPDEEIEEDLLPGMVCAPYDNLLENCIWLASKDSERNSIAKNGFEAVRRRDECALLKMALTL